MCYHVLTGGIVVSVAARTHKGRVRINNEDSLLLERPFLFAIADGMGGYNAGEVASKLALEKLKAEKEDLYGKNGFALVSKLYQIMRDVNVEVYKKAQSEYTLEGMGTTLSGIYFNGKGKGYVFKEEAFNHPQKNMLTRGIGVNKNVDGDVFVIDIYTDDTILLCSDGLTDMLHDNEIAEYLQKEDTEDAADALLSASLEKGGRDNISFIILKLDRKEVEHDGR